MQIVIEEFHIGNVIEDLYYYCYFRFLLRLACEEKHSYHQSRATRGEPVGSTLMKKIFDQNKTDSQTSKKIRGFSFPDIKNEALYLDRLFFHTMTE